MSSVLIFHLISPHPYSSLFFFNDTATTEIYTLSLHDALPIYPRAAERPGCAAAGRLDRELRDARGGRDRAAPAGGAIAPDRKSTRLNSSHLVISYAVFCLKKKKKRRSSQWRQLK